MSEEITLEEQTRKHLFEIEPKIDLLHELLGYGRFDAFTITGDGFWLAQAKGDLGFNHFMGKPNLSGEPALRLHKEYNALTQEEKRFVVIKLSHLCRQSKELYKLVMLPIRQKHAFEVV